MNDLESDPKHCLHLAIGSHYNQQAKEQWINACRSNNIDWQTVAKLAYPVGLAPLFFSSLEIGNPEGIPSTLSSKLKKSYFETASINTLALHHLKIILRQFAHNAVPIMVLKGAALLLTAYDNLALRPMVDVDLLIAFSNLKEASKILEGLGYFTQYPLPFENESGLFWNEVLLKSDKDGTLPLELHWHLIDNPYYAERLPVEKLYQRAQMVTRDSISVLLLSPEDQILHLCIHNLFHHLGKFQRAPVDAAFVIQKYQTDLAWEALIGTAKVNNLSLALATTLLTAAEDWFAPVPDDVLTELRNLRPSKKESFFLNSQRSEFLKLLRTFITLPGARLKSQFLIGQLFPSRDFMAWRYGTSPDSSRPAVYSERYLTGLSGFFAEISKRGKKAKKN